MTTKSAMEMLEGLNCRDGFSIMPLPKQEEHFKTGGVSHVFHDRQADVGWWKVCERSQSPIQSRHLHRLSRTQNILVHVLEFSKLRASLKQPSACSGLKHVDAYRA